MSDRRKDHDQEQHNERRLNHRSNHLPEEHEAWRLRGRHAKKEAPDTAETPVAKATDEEPRLGGRHVKEDVPITGKLQAISPAAWTQADYTGRHCIVGPFPSLEHAEAFSNTPHKQHDHEAYFFQLRTLYEYWFVEVSPDGSTKLLSTPELADEVVYENMP